MHVSTQLTSLRWQAKREQRDGEVTIDPISPSSADSVTQLYFSDVMTTIWNVRSLVDNSRVISFSAS